jgi:hypothetical protein
VDNDVCVSKAFWSTITAAVPDSAFAGVLAGLLIAAVAALIVWHEQGATESIALFSSGVPILAITTYLFTVIGALHYPPGLDYTKTEGTGDKLCNQLWSEWLLATGSLFIGSAVLVCGLGWALVSYANNLAVNLCKANIRIERVEYVRKFAIRLNAWLTAAIIIAATALLMVTNVLYLVAIGKTNMHLEKFGERWYILFFIYLGGLYFIGRASYVIFIRTRTLIRANKNLCAAYATSGPPAATDSEVNADVGSASPPDTEDARFARRNKLAIRAAQEFAVVIWVALGALLAAYLTSGQAFNQPRGIVVSPVIVIYVVVVYIIVRAAYVLVAGIVELVLAKKDDTPTNNGFIQPVDEGSVERIRINYAFGWLPAATYSVVLLAILGTFVVATFTQGPLWYPWRIFISLLMGGFYPAVVLTLLSSSVPAANDVEQSKWKTLWSNWKALWSKWKKTLWSKWKALLLLSFMPRQTMARPQAAPR